MSVSFCSRCVVAILLLLDGVTSSKAGPVRLIPLDYWKGPAELPTEADSCSQDTPQKQGQEVRGVYFSLFKGHRGYGTLGDEETLKKQAAACLRPDKLDNFIFNDAKAEVQFTFPVPQDSRCVMWFVLAMHRSGVRYTIDLNTKTFNVSLPGFNKGKNCEARSLPPSGDSSRKFRFCIVRQCDSEHVHPIVSEPHVIYSSNAVNPKVNPLFDYFCDLGCRYESYKMKETAVGTQIEVNPKTSYTSFVQKSSAMTVVVQTAKVGGIGYWIAGPIFVFIVIILFFVVFFTLKAYFALEKISPIMKHLLDVQREAKNQQNLEMNKTTPAVNIAGPNKECAEQVDLAQEKAADLELKTQERNTDLNAKPSDQDRKSSYQSPMTADKRNSDGKASDQSPTPAEKAGPDGKPSGQSPTPADKTNLPIAGKDMGTNKANMQEKMLTTVIEPGVGGNTRWKDWRHSAPLEDDPTLRPESTKRSKKISRHTPPKTSNTQSSKKDQNSSKNNKQPAKPDLKAPKEGETADPEFEKTSKKNKEKTTDADRKPSGQTTTKQVK
ncbi:hypothetical protein QR680_003971 [Steinernema hermaphroditum]|uniref:ZP domain-containing protein n=1 Tax=Steinernema hermaphroditum TaxID=289476 RepID=A0AA39HM81_9BILA|nr:hypothetical protein QR680_003971 [Steinernema hermaphroditum]